MYDEVQHNLEFAKELHETLDGLTQNVSVTWSRFLFHVWWRSSAGLVFF